MGNSLNSEHIENSKVNNVHNVSDETLKLVNKDENEAIEQLYNNIVNSVDLIESVSNVFHFNSLSNNEFAEILILENTFQSINNFRKFITDSTRISSYKSIETLWTLLSKKHDKNDIIITYINVIYDIAYYDNNTDNTISQRTHSIDKLLKFILSYVKKYKSEVTILGDISFDDFIQWSNDYAPYLSKVFETYIQQIVWRDNISPSFEPFMPPSLEASSSSIINDFDILPLSLYSNRLQGLWKRLYTSEVDGMSFNRIAHHILGYNGPTCILIKVMDESHTVIGAFADDKWKEQNRFYGSYKDFVFSYHKDLRICRVKSDSNQAYRWLNMRSYGLPHGLGFGGSIDGLRFRLFIPESLENCIARSNCLTYETGKLLNSNDKDENNFEIDVLEVWGCGGEEVVNNGLHEQSNHRQMTEKTINQARKVDKAAFFNNSFDQEFLLTKTMQHKREMNERDI